MKIINLIKGEVAQVDDEDFDRLLTFRWYLSNSGYATSSIGGTKYYMHLEVIGYPPNKGDHTDHIDGNKLNNQKSNLRHVSHSVSMQNRRGPAKSGSGYYGVFPSSLGKFIARVSKDGKRIFLGTFSDPVEAAKIVDLKVRELFGEHARTNF